MKHILKYNNINESKDTIISYLEDCFIDVKEICGNNSGNIINIWNEKIIDGKLVTNKHYYVQIMSTYQNIDCLMKVDNQEIFARFTSERNKNASLLKKINYCIKISIDNPKIILERIKIYPSDKGSNYMETYEILFSLKD